MDNKSDLAPETKSAQALRQIDSMAGGLSPGIHPSTTYVRDENYQLIDARHSYGRDENPGFAVAERVLAELEGGSAALLFSSGTSAAMAVVQSLQPGDRIVAPKIMYWALRNWLIVFCEKWGLQFDLFDPADPDALASTVQEKKTNLLWIESPCNPTWDIIDIAEAADIDDAILHAFKGIEHLHDGAAIAFDEVDLVVGLRLDGLFQLGLEKVFHQTRINHGRRMAGRDADINGFGLRRSARGEHAAGNESCRCKSRKRFS